MIPGDLIASKYRLRRQLGQGSMGEVWAALNERTEGEVALKLISDPSPELRARLLLEARACGRLRHRNIVEVYDVGETAAGEPFLVMQLLSGETLAQRLARERRLDVRAAARVALDIARALRAAHAAGIVHRDLKPANVFLHREIDVSGDLVKVLDFGVSKVLTGEGGATSTLTGSLVGSPAYMSPEQARASKGIDRRTDLWSFGVVLFEMLTGERPFPNPSMMGVIAEILASPIPAPSSLVRGLPPGLDAVTAACLTRDVDARMASADSLIEQLRPFAEEPSARGGAEPRQPSTPDTDVATAPMAPIMAAPRVPITESAPAAPVALPPPSSDVDGSVDEQAPTAVLDRSKMPIASFLQQRPAMLPDATAPLGKGGTRPLTADERGAALAAGPTAAQWRAGPVIEDATTEDDDQRRTSPMQQSGTTAVIAGAPPAVTSTTKPLVQSPGPARPMMVTGGARQGSNRHLEPILVIGGLVVVILMLIGATLLLRRPPASVNEAALSAQPTVAVAATATATATATAAPSASESAAAAADTVAPSASPSAGEAAARPAQGRSPARLNLDSKPASRVTLDDRPLGTTPRYGVVVTPGQHVVTFQHSTLGKKIVVTRVRPGETATVSVELGKR